MHRRQYLPESHNRRNMLQRDKLRAERHAALERAERAERDAESARDRAARQESFAGHVRAIGKTVRKFFTKPITLGRRGA